MEIPLCKSKDVPKFSPRASPTSWARWIYNRRSGVPASATNAAPHPNATSAALWLYFHPRTLEAMEWRVLFPLDHDLRLEDDPLNRRGFFDPLATLAASAERRIGPEFLHRTGKMFDDVRAIELLVVDER